jgi:dihydrofolate reductase
MYVALTREGVIGDSRKSPLWSLPADLRHFREVTTGHTIIMGRKTFEGIGHPLANRRNIVITRDKAFGAEGVDVAHSLEKALDIASNDGEIIITGGGEVFRQALPLADKLYLTIVDASIPGDIYFNYDKNEWREVGRDDHRPDEENIYPYSFLTLQRKAD